MVAMLSYLSAHKPAIKPKAPIKNEENNKKIMKQKQFKTVIFTNRLKQIIDEQQIIKALVTEAKIIANVTSPAESGLPIKSMIFPIILPPNIEDDEWEKDC